MEGSEVEEKEKEVEEKEVKVEVKQVSKSRTTKSRKHSSVATSDTEPKLKSVKQEGEENQITESLPESTSKLNLVDHVKKESLTGPTSKLDLFDCVKASRCYVTVKNKPKPESNTVRKSRKWKSASKTTSPKVACMSEINVKQSSQESKAVKSNSNKE